MPRIKRETLEYRNYNLPLSFPVLLLSGEEWKISEVPSDKLHFHNCLELGLCVEGSGILKFPGYLRPFQEGDLTCIPRNVPHTTYSTGFRKSRWTYLFMDQDLLFGNRLPLEVRTFFLEPSYTKDYPFIFPRENYPDLSLLFQNVVRELEEDGPLSQTSAYGLLLSLYVKLYRILSRGRDDLPDFRKGSIAEQPSPAHIQILHAVTVIENNYTQQITIEQLATDCHISPQHFRRLFHEILGSTPQEYLNHTRIMRACVLLCSTQDSILSVSEQVGFQSISSFNRLFLRYLKMTPRDYRKQFFLNHASDIKTYEGWTHPEE